MPNVVLLRALRDRSAEAPRAKAYLQALEIAFDMAGLHAGHVQWRLAMRASRNLKCFWLASAKNRIVFF